MDAFFTLLGALIVISTFGVGAAAALAFWTAAILALAWIITCGVVVLVLISFVFNAAGLFVRKLRGAV